MVNMDEGEAMSNKIADVLGGKTTEDVKWHYELLVVDVDAIMVGGCRCPCMPMAGIPRREAPTLRRATVG